MKFKVGDLVKVVAFKSTPDAAPITNVNRIPLDYMESFQEVARIDKITLNSTWKYTLYVFSLGENYYCSEEEIDLIPICRTEIYKALTEET